MGPLAGALTVLTLLSCASVWGVRVQQLQSQRGGSERAGFVYGSLQEYTEALAKSQVAEERRLAALGIGRLIHDIRSSSKHAASVGDDPYKAAVHALWTSLGEDEDATVRNAAFDTLARLGDLTPEAAAAVLSENRYGDMRAKAARHLAGAREVGPETRRCLIESFADMDPEVRLACFDALEQQGWWNIDKLRYFLEDIDCPILRAAFLRKLAGFLRPMNATARHREILDLLLDVVDEDEASLGAMQRLRLIASEGALPAEAVMGVLASRAQALMHQALGGRPQLFRRRDAASARQTFEETLEDDDDVPDLVPEDYNAGYVDAVVRGTAAHRLGKLLAYWDFLALMGVPGAKPDTAFFAQAMSAVEEVSLSSKPLLNSLGGDMGFVASDS